MIVEERIYTLNASADLGEFLKIYTEEALPVQRQMLGGFLGYFSSMFGQLNQVVHWWAYSDLNDRLARRDRLHKDPQWLAVLPKLRPMLKEMENRILTPMPFSPIKTLPVQFGEEASALSGKPPRDLSEFGEPGEGQSFWR
jgi:hypothetical protein